MLADYFTHAVYRGIKREKILAAPTDFPALQGRMGIEMAVRLLEGKLEHPHAGPLIHIVEQGNLDDFSTRLSLAPGRLLADVRGRIAAAPLPLCPAPTLWHDAPSDSDAPAGSWPPVSAPARWQGVPGTMHASLESCPALVLNADYRPLSYFPLSVWGWQDAVKAAFLDRVTILSTYDRAIRSPSMAIRLPSVVALKRYRPLARRPAFTRFNVFLRDSFTCQYCVTPFPVENLTFDHLVPRSRGGRTTWENVIAACSACNLSKGNRLPQECGMRPQRKPRAPSAYDLHEAGRRFPPRYLHESWGDYLYWDSELDPD